MSEPPENQNINIYFPTDKPFPYLCCLFCKKYFNSPNELFQHEIADELHKRIVNQKLQKMHQFNDYLGNSADREAVERRRRQKLEQQMQQARKSTPRPPTSLQWSPINMQTSRVGNNDSTIRRNLFPYDSAKRKRNEDVAVKKDIPKRTRVESAMLVGPKRDITMQVAEPQVEDARIVKQKAYSECFRVPAAKPKIAVQEKLPKPLPSTCSEITITPVQRNPPNKAPYVAKPDPSVPVLTITTVEKKVTKPPVKRSLESNESLSKKPKKQPTDISIEHSYSSESSIMQKPKHSSVKHIEILDTSWIRSGILGRTIDKLQGKPSLLNGNQVTREEFEKTGSSPESKNTSAMDDYRRQPWFLNSRPGTSGLARHCQMPSDERPEIEIRLLQSSYFSNKNREVNESNDFKEELEIEIVYMPINSPKSNSSPEKNQETPKVLTIEPILKLDASTSRLRGYDTSFRDLEERPLQSRQRRRTMVRFLDEDQSGDKSVCNARTRRRSWP